MKNINVVGLTEKEFERKYYAVDDPDKQIELLNQWRKHQCAVVSTFIDQIRLMASEQYRNLEHFLLELLQNADDNTYKSGISPTVEIVLQKDKFILSNNEVGIKPDHLFAITYAAASTKIREKSASTYIGEKGIGFKSVFAVADYVDIHSPPYHFRLNNDEFIVPHKIEPVSCNGTKIIIKLKQSNPEIPEILSRHLESIYKTSQEFTLFLQKIEILNINNYIAGIKGKISTLRDKEKNYYIVENGGIETSFFTVSFTKKIPKSIVLSRFRDLDDDLDREMVFAIPLPKSKHIMPKTGRMFSFLPTNVKTGTPIHIQVDAKTTTNRENIVEFNISNWNKYIFNSFADDMTQMYVLLTKEKDISYRLPEYLPINFDAIDLNNDDLQSLISAVLSRLEVQPIVLDRHGEFKRPEQVKMLPPDFFPMLYEDKYEEQLNNYFSNNANDIGRKKDHDQETFTFLDPQWYENYKKQLQEIGVEEIDFEVCLYMLKKGVPSSVSLENSDSVRSFLLTIIDFFNKQSKNFFRKGTSLQVLKKNPVFPLVYQNKKKWGGLDANVMWLQSNTPHASISTESLIVDPEYTYSPGGRETQKEKGSEIAAFNRKFREFLSDQLAISPYSITEFYKKTIIKDLQNLSNDIDKNTNFSAIEGKWAELYAQIWKRRKTILSENSERYYHSLFLEISMCKIPVKYTDSKEDGLEVISKSFLGPEFKIDENLFDLYKGSDAPIISLKTMRSNVVRRKGKKSKKKQKVNFQDWKEFLLECKAKDEPYFEEKDLSEDPAFRHSSSDAYQDNDNIFAKEIIAAINNHKEYIHENTSDFYLRFGSISLSIDKYSLIALNNSFSDYIANRLSSLFPQVKIKHTIIKFAWGQKHKSRSVSFNYLIIYEQIKNGLFVRTNKGIVNSIDCFEDNEYNRSVLGELVSYVKKDEYDAELLCKIGVKNRVNSNDIRDLIAKWYKNTPSNERTAQSFAPYINAVIEFCKFNYSYKSEIIAEQYLYAPDKDEMMHFLEWRDSGYISRYPKSIIDKFFSTLDLQKKTSYQEIIDSIFHLSDLMDNSNLVLDLLSKLSRHSMIVELDDIGSRFISKLKNEGLVVAGKRAYSTKELPLVWDVVPMPEETTFPFCLYAGKKCNDLLRDMMSSLQWPIVSSLDISPDPTEVHEIEDHVARQIFLVFEELRHTSSPEVSQKIYDIEIFNSIDLVKERIKLTESIKIMMGGDCNHFEINVPYWFTGNEFFVLTDQDLEKILPEFLDFKCNTTFSSLFKYIWVAKEAPAREYTHSEGADSDIEIPEHPLSGMGFEPSGIDPHSGFGDSEEEVESLLDEEELDDDINTPEDDIGQYETVAKDSKRRRLFSYVSQAKTKRQNRSQQKTEQTKKIEQSGAKLLVDYFQKLGEKCISVEKDNKGYDFEITIGNENFYIELKSTKDKWEGWEHCLTPNEFQEAVNLGDKYFLCVIDQVLSDNYQFYFIQNPANNIDGFLFDHPWKAVSTNMTKFIERIKLSGDEIED